MPPDMTGLIRAQVLSARIGQPGQPAVEWAEALVQHAQKSSAEVFELGRRAWLAAGPLNLAEVPSTKTPTPPICPR